MGGRGGSSGMSGGNISKMSDSALARKRESLATKNRATFKAMMKAKKEGRTEDYNKLREKHRSGTEKIKKYDAESKKRRKGQESIKLTNNRVNWDNQVTKPTTTYERARKRRMSNFDSWFFGNTGSKK